MIATFSNVKITINLFIAKECDEIIVVNIIYHIYTRTIHLIHLI